MNLFQKGRLIFFLMLSAAALGQEVRRAIPLPSTSLSENSTPVPLGTPPVSAWQTMADWLAHDPGIQEAWKNYQQQRYVPIAQWAQNELPSRIPRPTIVRYFFGGPDVLSVLGFFPQASTYLLCGMEPVGRMPTELSPEGLQHASEQVREATKTFLLFGYFITKEMKAQMSSGPVQGVLPILLTFLALSDHQILSVELLALGGRPGVKIRFVPRGGGAEQQLFYAQANLSNEESRAFLKWAGSFGPGAAYLKAASYLLHEDSFSRARDFLLTYSDTILQDDSGVPLRFFEQEKISEKHAKVNKMGGSAPLSQREENAMNRNASVSADVASALPKSTAWNFYFFGDYKGPIELFRKYDQPPLAAAYAASGLRGPMPFGTGYHFNTSESGGANLLLAVKKNFVPRAKEAQ